MPENELFLLTVYTEDGRCVESHLATNLEDADAWGREHQRILAPKGSYKIWICQEVER